MKFNENREDTITINVYNDLTDLIYFLIKDGEVVYVGQTTQGIIRPLQHKDKEWNELKIIPCKTEDLTLMEDMYITKYKPIYNKAIGNTYYSLLKARNHIRSVTPYSDITIPNIKKIASRLGINIVEQLGNRYIFVNDVAKIKKYLMSLITPDIIKNGGEVKL